LDQQLVLEPWVLLGRLELLLELFRTSCKQVLHRNRRHRKPVNHSYRAS